MATPMKRMPTVMRSGHQFSMVPSTQIERSVFDRSHGHKTTFDAGLLIPVYVDEVLPGDTFTLRMTALARLATPLKPFMDNMYFESFFFFVPYRLVWSNFVKFMGEQVNPGDSISFTVPVTNISASQYTNHTVQDYMGLNTALGAVGTFSHSCLPIRAYNLIYNQWFRDENLVSSVVISTGDGPDAGFNLSPYKRGKRHDYFTSCLPFLQKGAPVLLPLGSTAPVVPAAFPVNIPTWKFPGSGTPNWTGTLQAKTAADPADVRLDTSAVPAVGDALHWSTTGLITDLAGATAATINDLRQAFQIQKLLERDARGGTRYTEIIFSHFRVRSPDARLQRAEYLGGGSSPLIVNPVTQHTQTGVTGGATPLGNLAAQAGFIAQGHGFSKSFTEHGVIIGIVNVRADLTYGQGMERFWSRSTRYDFFWPALAHIGEQAVKNKELFLQGVPGTLATQDDGVFGYQERYAEYRYKPSRLSGLFKTQATGTLELWHLSEKFAALPVLGQTFIEDQTETVLDTRVAVPTEPDFTLDAWFDLKCARPMPVFGVPQLIDHF